jgi:hypothetical protein
VGVVESQPFAVAPIAGADETLISLEGVGHRGIDVSRLHFVASANTAAAPALHAAGLVNRVSDLPAASP